MYEEYTAIKAIGYYFVRFVVPLFAAESLCIFTLPKRKWWISFYLSSSLFYFVFSLIVVYFNVDIKIGWFRIIFLLIFLLSLIPMFFTYKLRPMQIILFALSAYAVQNFGDNLSSLIIFSSGLTNSKYELYQSLCCCLQ